MRRLAGASAAFGVATMWISLYRAYPTYPPPLEWSLSFAGGLFLVSLALMHRIHRGQWPGVARAGFVVSQFGSCLWGIGGIPVVHHLLLAQATRESRVMEFIIELLKQPQPGWGLLCAGLIPIGYGAIKARLSLPARVLMPLGGLLLLGEPLKYWLGTREGGLSILVAFGAGWLVVAVCLLVDDFRTTPATNALGASSLD